MLTPTQINFDFFNECFTSVRKTDRHIFSKMRNAFNIDTSVNLISYYSMESYIKKYHMYLKLKAEFEC